MKDEPPAKRRIRLGKLWCWMVAIIVCVLGWQMWKLHLYNNALREAKESIFTWKCKDGITVIRQDRHAAREKIFGEDSRLVEIGEVRDVARYRDILLRLRPTQLIAHEWENVDVLEEGLPGLRALVLDDCPNLKNVDGLRSLNDLRSLQFNRCDALENTDDLLYLTGLQTLIMQASRTLKNVDGLKGLGQLQEVNLGGCRALQNVDGLKSLANLKHLSLAECYKIPAAALRELRAALPNTDITFPDGSKNPPQ